jgi:hypothetical protein
MTLKSQISSLAESFAAQVLAAIRGASLQEILEGGAGTAARTSSAPPVKRGRGRPRKDATVAPVASAPAAAAAPKAKRGKGGRLARRSPEDLQHVVGLIVAKLGERKAGMRSEELQKALKLDKKEITGPLNLALSTKKVVKTGQKRSTTYFAK